MLWLVIAATIGANIAFGTGYGLLGALISAWPAVAFIGSVEIAMRQAVPGGIGFLSCGFCYWRDAMWLDMAVRPGIVRPRPR